MIYIDCQTQDPYFIFALEEFLCRKKKFTDTVFILWQCSDTVLLSRYQKSFEEFDKKQVLEKSLNIIRRNTGGGTLYLDLNICQFSFITPAFHNKIDFSPYINKVAQAIKKLGANVEFNSRNDLKIENKKISGNAQTIIDNFTLHHGSILFDTDLKNLDIFLKNAKHNSSPNSKKSVANISDYLDDNLSIEEFMHQIKKEILHEEKVQIYELTNNDIEEINKIKKDKFLSLDWTFDKPECHNFYRTNKYPGGKIEIYLNIINEKIENCHFYGDFFAIDRVSNIESTLIGVDFKKEIVSKILNQKELSNIIYQIDNDDIIDLIFNSPKINNNLEYY